MGRSEADRRRESANYWGSNGDTLVTEAVAVNRTSRAVRTAQPRGSSTCKEWTYQRVPAALTRSAWPPII